MEKGGEMEREVPDEVRQIEAATEGEVQRSQFKLLHVGIGVGLLTAGAAISALAILAIKPQAAVLQDAGPAEAVAPAAFSPPAITDIPDGPAGDAIKRGKAIFDDPGTMARPFVGNALACRNCHLDSGRKADAAPMWAAWVLYPEYRQKNKMTNTMEDRIRDCFRFSMNAPNSPAGVPPPDGFEVYRDLQAYFHWLAKGAPTGQHMAGAGFRKLQLSAAGYDPARGAAVYQQICAACHGPDGQGQSADGKVSIPPLWGSRSYNWGAGMAQIDTAAGFIKANMPFGQGDTLTDQQAWDVAAFVNSHERPRDPRQTATVADNANANFSGQLTYYGKAVNGKLLGVGAGAAR
jgi:thiosulfate dehydrogenase